MNPVARFCHELMQSHKFLLGQGVNGAEKAGKSFVQCNFEIRRSMLANLPALDLLICP